MTPLEIIFAAKSAGDTRAELDKAATQVIDAAARLSGQISGHANEYARLCAQHGRDALRVHIVEMYGEATAAAIDASTTALQSFWASVSPYPFPELPAVAVPPVVTTDNPPSL